MKTDNKTIDYAVMSERFDRKKSLWIKIALIITVICTAAQTVALLLDYEASRFAYRIGGVLGTVSSVLFVIGVLIITVFAFKARNESAVLRNDSPFDPSDRQSTFFAIISGGTTLISAINYCLNINDTESKMPLLLLIAAILTAAYFVLSVFLPYNRTTIGIVAVLGVFPVLIFVDLLVSSYFEEGAMMRDPMRIFAQLTFIAFMLYFLSELRGRVGRIHLGWYTVSGMIAFLFGIGSSVSYFAAQIADAMSVNKDFTDIYGSLFLALAELVLSFYILSRVVSVKADTGDDTAEKAAELKKTAEELKPFETILSDTSEQTQETENESSNGACEATLSDIFSTESEKDTSDNENL